jgi:hypothetical protein
VSKYSARGRRAPSILDTDELHYLPHEVWVPIQAPAQGATEVALELRETARNGVALVAFSSAEALEAGCGPGRAFVTIPAGDLDRLRRVVGFGCIVFDTGLPEHVHDEPLPDLVADHSLASGLIYLPSRPHRMGDSYADIQLYELETGEVALLAYSSPQLVRACCGIRQPWVSIPAEAVEETCSRVGADVVVFDHQP